MECNYILRNEDLEHVMAPILYYQGLGIQILGSYFTIELDPSWETVLPIVIVALARSGYNCEVNLFGKFYPKIELNITEKN